MTNKRARLFHVSTVSRSPVGAQLRSVPFNRFENHSEPVPQPAPIPFIAQGMIVGVVGTFLGAVAGLGGAVLLDRLISLPEDIYTISKLPVSVDPTDVILTCIVALTICFLATIYPSLRAARLEPVEALRYE